MNITGVEITLIDNHDRVKAYAKVWLDGCFVIHNLKVIDGQDGLGLSPLEAVGEAVEAPKIAGVLHR